MKRANQILNTVMGSVFGIFIGHSAYICWDFAKNPGLYEMQSAPWYTGILSYGIVTSIALLICLILKLIIRKRGK